MHPVTIIGGGPGGLTAALYLGRGGIPCVLVERMAAGGTLLTTETVDNYPGFPDGITGTELAERMHLQAQRFGVHFLTDEATHIVRGDGDDLTVVLAGGQRLQTSAVIVATGGRRRRLEVPGEDALAGRGVSYCAVCDGPLFRGRTVAVVGGGDTALEDALILAKTAAHVYLIHRRDQFRAVAHLQNAVRRQANISLFLSRTVAEIRGTRQVEAVVLRDVSGQTQTELAVDGVFVSIGLVPNTDFVASLVAVAQTGHIITDETMATSCPGVFAVGDCRRKTFYQIVTACGDGAVAAQSVQRYLEQKKG